MAIIRAAQKGAAAGRKSGGCKWCEMGECWTHGGEVVVKTTTKRHKGGGKGRGGCKWCALGECWNDNCRAGGARSGGARGGGGGGQWMFVPQRAKGFGKGKNSKGAQARKTLDKLQEVDAELKVWIGGLPRDVSWKDIEKHFEETCGTKPKLSEVMPKGKGCCSFTTAEEAQTAIATVNGSELNGQTIEVDVWTEKEKNEGEERAPKRKFGAAFVKSKWTKNEGAKVDAALKVWVGGLIEKTTGANLKKHFTDSGCAADLAETMKRGTASVTFKTAEDAVNAIATMNGTELDGQTIEVDVWTQSEKKDKKLKQEE